LSLFLCFFAISGSHREFSTTFYISYHGLLFCYGHPRVEWLRCPQIVSPILFAILSVGFFLQTPSDECADLHNTIDSFVAQPPHFPFPCTRSAPPFFYYEANRTSSLFFPIRGKLMSRGSPHSSPPQPDLPPPVPPSVSFLTLPPLYT